MVENLQRRIIKVETGVDLQTPDVLTSSPLRWTEIREMKEWVGKREKNVMSDFVTSEKIRRNQDT